MKRILITQRVDYISERKELYEGVDIRFCKVLSAMGFLPIPVSCAVQDKVSYIMGLNPDAILLSGGNDIGSSEERDKMEFMLLGYAKSENLPVFGICRGMELMNLYQGGSLSTIDGHVSTYHYIEGSLYPKGRKVNSFHNFAIFPKNLGSNLDILAKAPDGTVEAIRHFSLPWLAVMWHPEREVTSNVCDWEMIKNHLEQI